MLADRKWVRRNLGFDPITTRPPRETFAVVTHRLLLAAEPWDMIRKSVTQLFLATSAEGVRAEIMPKQ